MSRVFLVLAALLTSCSSRDMTARRWLTSLDVLQGLELVALDRWQGGGVNGRLHEQFLELRCKNHPTWPWPRIRRAYWPGPEWRGEVTWSPEQVVYTPGWPQRSKVKPLVFAAPEIQRLQWCRV